MRVLFVTPECAPLTKTGGLGDVSAALPAALRALGHEVKVLIPGYPAVLEGLHDLHHAAVAPDTRILETAQFLVLDHPRLYRRGGGPYQNASGEDWADNALRFGLLSRMAALLGTARSPLAWRPEVVHCNDWPAGLAPVYLAGEPERAATVMTVHNLAFQGNFDASGIETIGLPPGTFTMQGVEFHGRLSFLKGGLAYADAITTVSPTYAREIQTQALGCGLDGLLRQRAGALTGILNGIDTDVWNPATDVRIAQRYDASSLENKAINKHELQKRLKLELRPDIPLIGMVGRLTHQKGMDLVLAALDELLGAPAQLALLGAGAREDAAAFAAAAARHPGALGVALGFDEDLAHAIEAGADLFLMPSRFEPCGLTQMYSQRYGTLPVARATGGLADTIADGETGFLFERADSAALLVALRRAAALWRDLPRRRAMQRAGMARDFSWSAPARRYADLYSRLARRLPP